MTNYPDASEARKQRWISLVRYDPEISPIAAKLRPFGQQWIDEFERAFFSLNEDRKYLPNIVERLLHEAKESIEQAWLAQFSKTSHGEVTTEASIRILILAAKKGYEISVGDDKRIVVKKADRGTSYLYSNSDIERFGQLKNF